MVNETTERFQKVRMLILDVDGVMTDAGMYYSENGDEIKKFNTRDGKGLELVRDIGLSVAIVTSERTKIVERRADKLKIDQLYQGVSDKLETVKQIALKNQIDLDAICYMGDDLNDLEVMQAVGLAVTVNDGEEEIKKAAHYITTRKGGEGAVREVCNLLLHANAHPR